MSNNSENHDFTDSDSDIDDDSDNSINSINNDVTTGYFSSYNQFVKNIDQKSQETFDTIKSDGIVYDEYKKIRNIFIRNKLTQCDYCQKFYKLDDSIVILYGDGQLCWHCLFWCNYSLESRPTVDGVYGKSIAEYIIEYKDEHDKNSCTKIDSCFICDHLNKKEIVGILYPELVNVFTNEDNDSLADSSSDDNYNLSDCVIEI